MRVPFSVACGQGQVSRRELVGSVAGWLFLGGSAAEQPPPALPTEVAGIRLPASHLAQRAASYSRRFCPEFLFNHCMRTFIFGAIYAEHHHVRYEPETAFVAAALHDLGLLRSFASAGKTFEVDGANAAEAFLRNERAPQAEADAAWNAIALHAIRQQFIAHQAGEVQVVSAGVGADFGGPDPRDIEPARVREILAAFPRLQFKSRFLALLTDHCHRKPMSQEATWLESFCHAQAPQLRRPSAAEVLAAAPFPE